MGECQAVFDFNTKNIKGIRVKRDEEHHGMCTVDYQDEQVKKELDWAVDCERQCEDAWIDDELTKVEQEQGYSDCVCKCKKKVDVLSTGSVKFWQRNNIVMEATMPIACQHFMKKDSIFDEGMDSELINTAFKKFETIGCITDKNEIREWVHAHEFTDDARDYEPMEPETPAICYLHAKSVGGCRLDDVMRVTKEAMT